MAESAPFKAEIGIKSSELDVIRYHILFYLVSAFLFAFFYFNSTFVACNNYCYQVCKKYCYQVSLLYQLFDLNLVFRYHSLLIIIIVQVIIFITIKLYVNSSYF